MPAGRLRHQVTIQEPALGSADVYGEQVEAWADVVTVSAEVRILDAIEAWKAKQSQPEATVQVTTRYNEEMTSDKRLLFGTRYLYPLSVVPDIKNTMMRVLCKEKL